MQARTGGQKPVRNLDACLLILQRPVFTIFLQASLTIMQNFDIALPTIRKVSGKFKEQALMC